MKMIIDEIEQVLLKYGYQDLFAELEDYVTELESDHKIDYDWLVREKEDLEDETREMRESYKSLEEELRDMKKQFEVFEQYLPALKILMLNHNYISAKDLEEFVESKAVITC